MNQSVKPQSNDDLDDDSDNESDNEDDNMATSDDGWKTISRKKKTGKKR